MEQLLATYKKGSSHANVIRTWQGLVVEVVGTDPVEIEALKNAVLSFSASDPLPVEVDLDRNEVN
jgi:hypothetical protein